MTTAAVPAPIGSRSDMVTIRRRHRRLILRTAVAAGLVLASADALRAQAQVTVDAIRKSQESKLAPTRTLLAVPAASASPIALPVPEVTLQTSREGTEATAVIGVSNPFWGVRMTFRSPIGKEADAEASPLSLTGLANQASVDVAFIRTRVFRKSVRDPDVTIEDLRLAFCKERGVTKCSDQAFSGDERQAFLDFGIHRRPTIFGAHIQVGSKSFDFVEVGSVEKVTEGYTSVAGGVSHAWLFPASQSALSISADAARDYAASRDTTLLCQPIATSIPGTERCDTRTIGRPRASTKVTGVLEYRRVFTELEGGQSRPVIGLGVQALVRAIEGGKTVWGVNAPVYFLQKKPDQNTSAGLNGGAAVGWDSQTGVNTRVFIGAAFSLIAKGFNQ